MGFLLGLKINYFFSTIISTVTESLQDLVESQDNESHLVESTTTVESDLVSFVSFPQEANATIVNSVKIDFFIFLYSIDYKYKLETNRCQIIIKKFN